MILFPLQPEKQLLTGCLCRAMQAYILAFTFPCSSFECRSKRGHDRQPIYWRIFRDNVGHRGREFAKRGIQVG